jgi:hypothetical protein
MPQPLSRVAPNSSYTLAMSCVDGGQFEFVFGKNPELGLLAMEAIAAWSQVEAAEYHTFAQFSGGPTTELYEFYMGLGTRREKINALRRHCDKRLSPTELSLFNGIHRYSASLSSQRDKIAHWCWGWMENRNDVILAIDPKLLTISGTDSLDHIYVFSGNDFYTLARDCHTLAIKYTQFGWMVGNQNLDERAQQCGELSKVSSIAAFMRPAQK